MIRIINIEYRDIRIIYSIIINNKLKDEKLETKHDLIWSNVKNFIIEEIQKMLDKLQIEVRQIKDKKENIIKKFKIIEIKNPYTNIKNYLYKDIYIKLLNKYQIYFNFKKYKLLPNYLENFYIFKN